MVSVAKHQQHINLKMLMSYKTFSKIIKHLMLSMLARSHFELVISRVILNSVLKRFHIPSRLSPKSGLERVGTLDGDLLNFGSD